MAKDRLKFTRDGMQNLIGAEKLKADLERRAKAIADACNAESEWGGYYSAASTEGDRARARVWNIKRGASDEESRNQRMIRNLDEGR